MQFRYPKVARDHASGVVAGRPNMTIPRVEQPSFFRATVPSLSRDKSGSAWLFRCWAYRGACLSSYLYNGLTCCGTPVTRVKFYLPPVDLGIVVILVCFGNGGIRS